MLLRGYASGVVCFVLVSWFEKLSLTLSTHRNQRKPPFAAVGAWVILIVFSWLMAAATPAGRGAGGGERSQQYRPVPAT